VTVCVSDGVRLGVEVAVRETVALGVEVAVWVVVRVGLAVSVGVGELAGSADAVTPGGLVWINSAVAGAACGPACRLQATPASEMTNQVKKMILSRCDAN